MKNVKVVFVLRRFFESENLFQKKCFLISFFSKRETKLIVKNQFQFEYEIYDWMIIHLKVWINPLQNSKKIFKCIYFLSWLSDRWGDFGSATLELSKDKMWMEAKFEIAWGMDMDYCYFNICSWKIRSWKRKLFNNQTS